MSEPGFDILCSVDAVRKSPFDEVVVRDDEGLIHLNTAAPLLGRPLSYPLRLIVVRGTTPDDTGWFEVGFKIAPRQPIQFAMPPPPRLHTPDPSNPIYFSIKRGNEKLTRDWRRRSDAVRRAQELEARNPGTPLANATWEIVGNEIRENEARVRRWMGAGESAPQIHQLMKSWKFGSFESVRNIRLVTIEIKNIEDIRSETPDVRFFDIVVQFGTTRPRATFALASSEDLSSLESALRLIISNRVVRASESNAQT